MYFSDRTLLFYLCEGHLILKLHQYEVLIFMSVVTLLQITFT